MGLKTLGDCWKVYEDNGLTKPRISYEGIFSTAERLLHLQTENEKLKAQIKKLRACSICGKENYTNKVFCYICFKKLKETDNYFQSTEQEQPQ